MPSLSFAALALAPLLALSYPNRAPLAARDVVQSSPSEVVTAFYMACNEGLYSKAETLVTKESLDYLKQTFALAGSFKSYCDDLTEEGTLTRIEIQSERVRGEGAKVSFAFHFKGGKSEPGEEALVKTPAGWRVQLLGQGK